MQPTIKVKKMRESAVLPARATPGSAAADLSAACDAPVLLAARGGRALIPTGIAIELPSPDYVALVFARSGLGVKKGVALSNAVGVIDSDYRGEISVGLVNLSDEDYTIAPGERIAQLAILPVVCAAFVEAEALGETQRGEGGFGSTGTQSTNPERNDVTR